MCLFDIAQAGKSMVYVEWRRNRPLTTFASHVNFAGTNVLTIFTMLIRVCANLLSGIPCSGPQSAWFTASRMWWK